MIIAGGTGFMGQAMAAFFGKDNHIVILTREAVHSHNNHFAPHLLKPSDGYNITYWRWDGIHIEKHWAHELNGADILINLSGRSVNCRYHQKNKKTIIDSRVQPTKVLGEAIRQCTQPPSLWINASSATTYRHAHDRPQDESSGEISELKNSNMPYSFLDRVRRSIRKCRIALRHGKNAAQYREEDLDFSVRVCREWEAAFFEQATPDTRKIALRTAITLGEGGVIVPYFNLLKFGLGGKQGNGRQMYSWVHIEDVCTLRKLTGHSIGFPAFSWMLELGAALIGTETELILKSRWVVPARLMQSGFHFKYDQVEEALKDLISRTKRGQYHLF